ncbi:ceramide synthase 1-like [Tropilaelaps mercedesae]|uniref:Ceramide synthase 1-like n=1 Tax=Tropilaelaps mercedesae TaxID=418985 RepID=A0A1V9XWQ8_9ACAR|nr:ceramide synthase 1-like [Tropilaelaps mercedesae]
MVDNRSESVVTGDEVWEAMPSYATLANDMVRLYNQTFVRYKDGSYRFPMDISEDFDVLFNFRREDVLLVMGLAVSFTLMRSVITKFLLIPLGKYLALSPESAAKLPESVWKLVYYGYVWGYAFRVVVSSGQYRFFQNPSSVWQGYSASAAIPSDIYWLYAVQGSFYIHGLYALFFQDSWRKDSVIMGIHHVVTIFLIWVSFVCRYHNIGSLVMLFHDFCDVELEFAKINVYLKVRSGRNHKTNDLLAAVSFLSMTVTWFISRLYYFPLKVLYACSTVFLGRDFYPDYTMLIVSMLLLLTAMNVFWFSQMIVFLYKILTGELSEVDDIREYDVVEKLERSNEKAIKDKKFT